MRIRIVSGLLGFLLLLLVLLSNEIIIGLAFVAVAGIAITEFMNALKHAGYKPIYPVAYFGCLPLVFIALNNKFHFFETYVETFKSLNHFSIFIYVLFVALLAITVFWHKKYSLNDISSTLLGVFYVAFLMSFMILLINKPMGKYFIWVVMFGAWGTDTFAYFTGRFLGRHKIIPEISPKKTVEGSIGGLAGSVILTAAFGYFVIKSGALSANYNVDLTDFIILGFANGIVSQLGDWIASSVKRYLDLKDFSNIMPGHGGILDRFDSILLITPIVYFYATFVLMA